MRFPRFGSVISRRKRSKVAELLILKVAYSTLGATFRLTGPGTYPEADRADTVKKNPVLGNAIPGLGML